MGDRHLSTKRGGGGKKKRMKKGASLRRERCFPAKNFDKRQRDFSLGHRKKKKGKRKDVGGNGIKKGDQCSLKGGTTKPRWVLC